MTNAEEAKQVLIKNWREGYTIPSPLLYPFQWLWDSGFIALGYAHFDEEKAWSELEFLLKGQWENGMIPHIIFHKESDGYFPGPDVWKAHLFDHACLSPRTSGITQPPVMGFILELLYELSTDKTKALARIKKILPALKTFHEYLFRDRDPDGEGLVYIRHNWESGLDNSPIYDQSLQRINVPDRDLNSIRRDLTHIKADNRPTNEEYLKYIWLVELFTDCAYDEQTIFEQCPFLIQDPVFNALLVKSNEALYRLSEMIGNPDEDFKNWGDRGRDAMNAKLWDSTSNNYLGFDLFNNNIIHAPSNAGFITGLFSGIPDQNRANQIVETHFESFSPDNYMMPTVMPTDKLFDPKRYWRGPIWINTNWMLIRGLQKYELHDLAQKVKTDTVTLIEEFGFYEYFSPSKETAEACGTPQFSWTAALYLDLLHRS